MTKVVAKCLINAPAESVFSMISDIEQFPFNFPAIERVEIISEVQHGLGVRFREYREMEGKEVETELEVTEYVENQHVRMIADSHGTVWDSIFKVKEQSGQTELSIHMEARAHKLLPKLLNPIFKGSYRKSLQQHANTVKANLEP